MVYESDFYTTRRPYSSRPIVSSYSVTSPIHTSHIRVLPGVSRVHTTTYTSSYPIYSSYPTVYHRSIPFVAHKRLVTGTRITSSPVRVVHSPVRVISSPIRMLNVRTRPSSLLNREYQRIENKVRSHPHYYATENYLNSSSVKDFDDETRDIRTSTNALLKKVHTHVERAHSVSPSSYASKYEQRYGPSAYIERVVAPSYGYHSFENFVEPSRKYAGVSHLASVRIVGNKGYPRRSQSVFRGGKVQNDVNLLSYYLKNRKAAAENESAPLNLASAKLDPHRASRKFTEAKPLEDPNVEIKEKQAARLDRMSTFGAAEEVQLEKKKAQRLEAAKQLELKALQEEALKKAEEAKLAEEARRAELERQEQLAAQAAAERAAELERKADEERAAAEAEEARQAELARRAAAEQAAAEAEIRAAEEARLAEEARVAEVARLAAEEERIAEEARLAEEAALKAAKEEERIAEEQRIAEEEHRQREEEMSRLAELEKLAEEDKEAELARQAAELSEIARQQELEAQREASEAAAASAAEAEADVEPIVEEPSTPTGEQSQPEYQTETEDEDGGETATDGGETTEDEQ